MTDHGPSTPVPWSGRAGPMTSSRSTPPSSIPTDPTGHTMAKDSAPWIRAHAKPLDLNVTKRCAETLRIQRAHAAGLLYALWAALSEQTETGYVGDFLDTELEQWAGWTGAPGAFAHFVRTQHVDEHGVIREWETYMGPLVRRRRQTRARVAAHRERKATVVRRERAIIADVLAEVEGRHALPPDAARPATAVACNALQAPADHAPPTAGFPHADGLSTELSTSPADSAASATKAKSSPDTALRGNGALHRDTYKSNALSTSQEREAKSDARSKLPASSRGQPHDPHAWARALGDEARSALGAFCRQFYPGESVAGRRRRDNVLEQLRRTLTPTGARVAGETAYATETTFAAALRAVVAEPPAKGDMAIVVALKKLVSGKANLVTNARGETATEAAAREARETHTGPLPAPVQSLVADVLGALPAPPPRAPERSRHRHTLADVLRLEARYGRLRPDAPTPTAPGSTTGPEPPAAAPS